jgi:hypothetical protein
MPERPTCLIPAGPLLIAGAFLRCFVYEALTGLVFWLDGIPPRPVATNEPTGFYKSLKGGLRVLGHDWHLLAGDRHSNTAGSGWWPFAA